MRVLCLLSRAAAARYCSDEAITAGAMRVGAGWGVQRHTLAKTAQEGSPRFATTSQRDCERRAQRVSWPGCWASPVPKPPLVLGVLQY